MCSITYDGGLERTSVSAWTGMDVSCTKHTTKSCSLLPYMVLSVHCTDSSPSLMPEVRVTTIYTTNHNTKCYITTSLYNTINGVSKIVKQMSPKLIAKVCQSSWDSILAHFLLLLLNVVSGGISHLLIPSASQKDIYDHSNSGI